MAAQFSRWVAHPAEKDESKGGADRTAGTPALRRHRRQDIGKGYGARLKTSEEAAALA